jgi:hypothetical protein
MRSYYPFGGNEFKNNGEENTSWKAWVEGVPDFSEWMDLGGCTKGPCLPACVVVLAALVITSAVVCGILVGMQCK